jgi:3-dehydroquinate synthase
MAHAPTTAPFVLAGDHPVVLGPLALADLQQRILRLRPSAIHLLGDENTLRHCLPELLAHVPAAREAITLSIPAGEGSKALPMCEAVWKHLAEHAADRQALLLCLGGGVVSDLGGFVASTYKRGIRCIHVPTTLLAMVDAAIGGKTGIDLGGLKNLVGTFHDPLSVHVHVPFLRSLGKRHLLNGLAEMIKHGLVRDAAHWEAIASAQLHDIDALAPLIHASAAIKATIVTEDPREVGVRKLLNFGHSIGHGIEAFSWESPQRALLHGEAIAIGMQCEAYISWRMELLDRPSYERITEQLRALFRPFELAETDAHRIVQLMRNDKKNAGAELRLTLLTAIGTGRVDVPVNAAQVLEALENYRMGVMD